MEEIKTNEKDRIEQVMQSEGLNSAQFAAEIGIKSPTLSHILNGRNNPSLDVLKRILDRYRMISSDWLILGIGPMFRHTKQSQAPSLFDNMNENISKSESYQGISDKKNNVVENEIRKKNETIATKTEEIPSTIPVSAKNVKKIIVYYSDNTFQEFDPK